MSTKKFGTIVLYTKEILGGILKYEWKQFEEYATVNFKYLGVLDTNYPKNYPNNYPDVRVQLQLQNGNWIDFETFITKENLVKFICDCGYNLFALFNEMTTDEIKKIRNLSFDELMNEVNKGAINSSINENEQYDADDADYEDENGVINIEI